MTFWYNFVFGNSFLSSAIITECESECKLQYLNMRSLRYCMGATYCKIVQFLCHPFVLNIYLHIQLKTSPGF